MCARFYLYFIYLFLLMHSIFTLYFRKKFHNSKNKYSFKIFCKAELKKKIKPLENGKFLSMLIFILIGIGSLFFLKLAAKRTYRASQKKTWLSI